MPFTFSHPAIVLPLYYLPKKWFSLTALVIGSLMPDLEAYMRFSSQKAESHNWPALIWFCLPAGLLLSLLYHQFVRNSFVNNLPPWLQQKIAPYTRFDWLQYLKENKLSVVISFVIGGASHLLWDSFSHFGGLLQKIDPALGGNTRIGDYNIEIPYLIQYLNSIIGLLVIVVVILSLPRHKEIKINKKWWQYWLVVISIATVVFAIRWLFMDTFKIDAIIVSIFTALLIALFICSLLFYKRRPVSSNP